MLTIDALRENPWTVIDHPLPPDASSLLLALADLAAQYCRASEYALMQAAREGEYTPTGGRGMTCPMCMRKAKRAGLKRIVKVMRSPRS